MYFSFVLPIIEYGNVVWGGSCDTHIAKVERIHIEAMRLVTGATSRSNIQRLYDETGWLSTRSRIDGAMIVMLFKIKNHISPNYLFELLPQQNAAYISYSLRNNNNIKLPITNREAFRRSFFPTAIRLWNRLNLNIRNSTSLYIFKQSLKKEYPEKPIMYYYGKRWASVHHARLRMQCSSLNFDLCCRLYVRDNPSCRCGANNETACHFFMHCPLYKDIQTKLIADVTKHTVCNTETLLFGNENLPKDANRHIFDAVHEFITQSNRFD